MIRTFAVIETSPRELRLLGLRPLVVVEASGAAVLDVARSLDAVARRMRLEWRRQLRLPRPRRLRVVGGDRGGC